MENLAISIIVILAVIFGAATLLLGKEILNLRGQLWSQEEQQYLEEQEALRALKAAHEKIKRLEICPPDFMGLRIQEQTAKVEILKSRFSSRDVFMTTKRMRAEALRALVSELDPFITEKLSDDGHVITLTLKVLREERPHNHPDYSFETGV